VFKFLLRKKPRRNNRNEMQIETKAPINRRNPTISSIYSPPPTIPGKISIMHQLRKGETTAKTFIQHATTIILFCSLCKKKKSAARIAYIQQIKKK
jgi:hypothetical protein